MSLSSDHYADVVDHYFKITLRGSSIKQEILAGSTAFFTMSYILLVNPQILTLLNIPADDVVVSTALSAGLSSIFCGIFSNLPFSLASGLGLSIYLVYSCVIGSSMGLPEVFTCCFISGLLLGLLSLTDATTVLIRVIPRSVKVGITAGMGLLVTLVGMTSVSVVVPDPQTILSLGPLNSYNIYFTIFGLVLVGTLLYHDVKGGILLGILIMTVITWIAEGTFPTSFCSWPNLPQSYIHFDSISGNSIPAIISFLFVLVFDISGCVFGMGAMAGLSNEDGSVPGAKAVFLSSSLGTMLGGSTGASPLIVYVECASGINIGGRTGLTAIVTGFLFLCSIFFSPVLAQIPPIATAPVLMLVGAMMMSQSKLIEWNDMTEAIPAFLTIVFMPFTFSISNGIAFGIITAAAFYITSGNIFSDISVWYKTYYDRDGFQLLRSEDRKLSSTFIDLQAPLSRTPSLIISKEKANELDSPRVNSLIEKRNYSTEL